jgi:serine/threonine protein kinase
MFFFLFRSLGIIAYTLLCGYPPFSSEDDEELLEMSAEGLYSFPSPYWYVLFVGCTRSFEF